VHELREHQKNLESLVASRTKDLSAAKEEAETGKPGQEPFSDEHFPRDQDADERDPRLCAIAGK
jgi:hypothetical protein